MSLFRKSAVATFMQVFITGGNFLFGILIAAYFGASSEMDSYVVVMNFITLIMVLLYVLHQKSLIPFLGGLTTIEEQERAFISIARFNNRVAVVIVAILFFASSPIIFLLAPGLTNEQNALASSLMKISALLILLTNIQGMVKAHIELHGKVYFSQGLEIGRVALLLVAFFFLYNRYGIYMLPIAHGISLVVILSVVRIWYRRTPFSFWGGRVLIEPEVKKYLLLVMPVLIGQIMTWLIRISDTFLASYLSEGTLSQMSYALRLVTNFSQLFTGIYIVYLPLLATLQAENDNTQHAKITLEGFTHLFFSSFTIVVFVTFWAPVIIQLLFERGQFTPEDTMVVATLLRFYSLMLLGAQLGGYLSSVYYGRQLTKRATIYSIISTVVNVILNFVLVVKFEAIGLAIASSLAFLVGNFLQLYHLPLVNAQIKRTPYLHIIIKSSIAVGISTFGMFMVKHVLVFRTPAATLIVYGIGYLVVTVAMGALLNIETTHIVLRRLKIGYQK